MTVQTDAEITLNVPGTNTGSVDENELGFRIGAGAQMNLNKHFNVRGLVRYQTADFDGVAENATTFTVGMNYTF